MKYHFLRNKTLGKQLKKKLMSISEMWVLFCATLFQHCRILTCFYFIQGLWATYKRYRAKEEKFWDRHLSFRFFKEAIIHGKGFKEWPLLLVISISAVVVWRPYWFLSPSVFSSFPWKSCFCTLSCSLAYVIHSSRFRVCFLYSSHSKISLLYPYQISNYVSKYNALFRRKSKLSCRSISGIQTVQQKP